MALIKCYECSKEISDSANTCPNCGAPVKKSGNPVTTGQAENRKVSILLIIGIIFIPIIFVWFLFRKGYSKKSRVIGVVYLLASVLLYSQGSHNQPSSTYNESQHENITPPSTLENNDGRPDPSKLYTISAQDILAEYESNTVAADNKFKNKWLIISGTVDSINTNITGSAYVTFDVDDSFNSPQASFIESQNDKLAALRKGQFIKAACIGAGDIIKTPMLKNCTLVE